MNKQDLIEAVKGFANENYEKGGWDHVVECLSDDDIAHMISKCRSVSGAIAAAKIYADQCGEARQEIESTVW